jgi:glycosyltransferase involved in cell wall biosynthesis
VVSGTEGPRLIRVAFTLIGGKNWTGGYNYLLNLLRVIIQRSPGVLHPVLFFGTDVDPQDAAPFRSLDGVEIVTSPHMNCARRNVSLLCSLVLGADPATRRMFHEHCIDVVFENARFHGARLGIPAIAWIPDFQHRELPHLFSQSAWWKRELGFRAQIAAGRTIMLSSNDAQDACERHYPVTVGRNHVVRFAKSLSQRPGVADVKIMQDLYRLPTRYFYLPNQFWQHKNHLLVIDALAKLNQAGHSVTVVASGKQLDPYKPRYFEEFLSRLHALDLADQFRILGLIPYEHVAPLMLGSTAVLNPSLFEGWSTTVEEAKALQVPMVLSDIQAHMEQAAGIARFFDRSSAESLAKALLDVWQGSSGPLPRDLSSIRNIEDPVQRFADDFVNLVNLVAAKNSREIKTAS